MNSSLLLPRCVLAFVVSCLGTSALFAQDAVTPIVSKPISNLTVPADSGPTKIKLKKTFALSGVTGELVRFSTTVGNVDVEMLSGDAPNTVATFLSYANAAGDNTSGVYSYTNTLIQRAVPGFIVQGGGFYVDASNQINQILGRPTIASEAGIKNTRGTIAMALSNGPNSGTGDFFFNVADNSVLDDTSDGGPFTVFGRTVGSLATLDAIEALPQQDFSSQLGGSFANVPLVNYNGSSASVTNLVYLTSVSPLPLVPASAGSPAFLSLSATSSNPDLVTPTIKGQKVILTYGAGMTGKATIKVVAKDSANSKVKAKFKVTVQ